MNVLGGRQRDTGMQRLAAVPRRPLAAALAGTLALLAGAAAQAQDTSAPGEDVSTLETVVVTANKRVENVREVGAAISVVSEEMLDNLGAGSLSDYADFVPGLQVQDGGTPGLTRISMRGVAALSAGATVATYVDEVPVGSSGLYQAATALMLDLLPYDLSRVEVLRGPQGTLYGAGSIGGLLKYVTRDPDLYASEFRVGFGMSSVQDGDIGWNGRFGASLPLVEDTLGLRVSYARRENPGFTDNVHTEGFGNEVLSRTEDVNGGVQTSARAALLYEGQGFTMDLSALRQTIDTDDRSGVALDIETGQPLFGDKVDRAWYPQSFRKDVDVFAATLEWDLGWGDFVSATGYSTTWTDYMLDSTVEFGEIPLMLDLPQGSSYGNYRLDLDKLTQEFRLISRSGGPFEWMVGAFYTKEEADQEQLFFLNSFDGSPLPAPYDAMFGDMAAAALPTWYRETAVFANASWRFSDRFKLDAGARYAQNDQEYNQVVTIDPLGLLGGVGTVSGESDESVFTWSLSPQYELADDVLLYARAASGYQPGGPNVAIPGMPSQVSSSMVDSYEVGLKSEFANRRVLLDLAVFNIDWEDIQVGTQINGVSGMVNGGEATSQGVELTAAFRATDSLRLGLNAAYTRADLNDDFEAVVVDAGDILVEIVNGLGGDRMPYTPKLSWSATADYVFDLRGDWHGTVGAAFRKVGDRISGTGSRERILLAADPSVVLDETVTGPNDLGGYKALDLYASVGNSNWTIRTYFNNVTDELGWSSVTTQSGALTGVDVQRRGIPIQPRTLGVELDYRF
ncbi:TonB-dependent receptor [Luteimonas qiangzhengi]|uniref:TonB-dependent receptor n=1 Tax=Luteimonas sp. MJ146 TaxID=3129240 RepID=UPI0031BA438B